MGVRFSSKQRIVVPSHLESVGQTSRIGGARAGFNQFGLYR